MALRLRAMRRVLKETGSIYLHCDPTASHYLKLLMDAIFDNGNYINEIIWQCAAGRAKGSQFNPRTFGNDTNSILFYSRTRKYKFNGDYGLLNESELIRKFPYSDKRGRYNTTTPLFCQPSMGARPNLCYEYNGVRNPHPSGWRVSKEKLAEMDARGEIIWRDGKRPLRKSYLSDYKGKPTGSLWADIPNVTAGNERLGYPTQKPLALLERIIKASSNEGDTVLDPFCGCGTTVHAAESLGRKWIGIDISKFSSGLIRDRILHNFKYLTIDDIDLRGTPDSVAEARQLARQDPFEFEKWVCGYIGAEGMFREPGERGADGGVDGVLKFFPVREGKKVKPEYAIVQVKGGHVSADAVKALHETVRRYEATAGVLVCFAEQLGTVENQRVKATFKDAWGSYPIIQGFSVESLLSDDQLDLPLYGYKRRGAMLGL